MTVFFILLGCAAVLAVLALGVWQAIREEAMYADFHRKHRAEIAKDPLKHFNLRDTDA